LLDFLNTLVIRVSIIFDILDLSVDLPCHVQEHLSNKLSHSYPLHDLLSVASHRR